MMIDRHLFLCCLIVNGKLPKPIRAGTVQSQTQIVASIRIHLMADGICSPQEQELIIKCSQIDIYLFTRIIVYNIIIHSRTGTHTVSIRTYVSQNHDGLCFCYCLQILIHLVPRFLFLGFSPLPLVVSVFILLSLLPGHTLRRADLRSS